MSEKAKRWQQNRQIYKDVEFPSGAVADLQHVSPLSMIMGDGSIPDSVYEFMLENQNGGTPSTNGNSREIMKSLYFVSEQAAREAFVSPRIVDEPDYEKDEIAIHDLTDADKSFLFNWLMGGGTPADALRRFHAAQQNGSVVAAPSLPSILPASQPIDGGK